MIFDLIDTTASVRLPDLFFSVIVFLCAARGRAEVRISLVYDVFNLIFFFHCISSVRLALLSRSDDGTYALPFRLQFDYDSYDLIDYSSLLGFRY